MKTIIIALALCMPSIKDSVISYPFSQESPMCPKGFTRVNDVGKYDGKVATADMTIWYYILTKTKSRKHVGIEYLMTGHIYWDKEYLKK